jgi:hypothetical protein
VTGNGGLSDEVADPDLKLGKDLGDEEIWVW